MGLRFLYTHLSCDDCMDWENSTGVKQCTFHWLISNDIAQKEMALNSVIIHDLITITCNSYVMKLYLLYLWQKWLILLHLKPV